MDRFVLGLCVYLKSCGSEKKMIWELVWEDLKKKLFYFYLYQSQINDISSL